VHFNPLNYDKTDGRAASFWAYKISENPKNLPLAVLGSVADYYLIDIVYELYEKNKDIFNTLFEINNEKREELFEFMNKYKFNNIEMKDEIINWIQYLVYSAKLIIFKNFFDFTFKLEDDKIIKIISKIEKMNLKEIKESIIAGKGDGFEDYNYLMNDYKKLYNKAISKKAKGNFLFFEYEGENGFSKTLSEQLCYENKNIPVIAVCFNKKGKELYHCSFRGNDFVVNTLVEEALKGLNGQGGGHPYAAGMRVAKKDFDIFKKKIIKLISTNK
jgi:single-stranded DNA-specific DHH superfamily exonuclease